MYEFEKLEIWGLSLDLIEAVHELTKKFVRGEYRWLADHMRRACTSVALNIAEGKGSGSDREFRRFLKISLRSLFEVVGCGKVAIRLKLVTEKDCERTFSLCDKTGAKTNSLISTLSQSIKE